MVDAKRKGWSVLIRNLLQNLSHSGNKVKKSALPDTQWKRQIDAHACKIDSLQTSTHHRDSSKRQIDFPFQNKYIEPQILLEQTHERRVMKGLPNMAGMMKQVQKMQEKMAEVQEGLETKTVVGDAGGGMVKVTANGKQRIVKVTIEKEVVNPDDLEMLEDLVLAATNKAIEEATRMAQEEMTKATSGLLPNIPGLNMPGM